MATVIKTAIAPQSAVARFVAADIKGGETAHNYRMSVIATAILEGYKGNARNLAEAVTFTTGRSRKARAYQAAFQALPTIEKLPFVGKWDAAANTEIRAQAAALSKDAEFAFETAFLSALDNAAAEAAAAKAAKPEPEPDAPAAIETALQAAAQAEVDADVVDIGAAVEAVAMAVQQGMLQADEMVLLRAALAAYDEAQSVHLPTSADTTTINANQLVHLTIGQPDAQYAAH